MIGRGDVDRRLEDILVAGPGRRQLPHEVVEGLPRLSANVPSPDEISFFVKRHGAGVVTNRVPVATTTCA